MPVTPNQPIVIRYPSAPARTRVAPAEILILQENFLAAMASFGDHLPPSSESAFLTPKKPSGTQVPGAPTRVSRPLLTSSPAKLLNF